MIHFFFLPSLDINIHESWHSWHCFPFVLLVRPITQSLGYRLHRLPAHSININPEIFFLSAELPCISCSADKLTCHQTFIRSSNIKNDDEQRESLMSSPKTGLDDNRLLASSWNRMIHERMRLDEVESLIRKRATVVSTHLRMRQTRIIRQQSVELSFGR